MVAVAAQRWLQSEAMTNGIETVCGGAAATGIANAHADASPPRDVSCSDVVVVGRDAAFFKSYPIPVDLHYSKHNAALKLFWEEAENRGLDAQEGRRVFGHNDVEDIRRLIRKASGGEEFTFDYDSPTTPWKWEYMVAHLDEPSIDTVVNGPCTPAAVTAAIRLT